MSSHFFSKVFHFFSLKHDYQLGLVVRLASKPFQGNCINRQNTDGFKVARGEGVLHLESSLIRL